MSEYHDRLQVLHASLRNSRNQAALNFKQVCAFAEAREAFSDCEINETVMLFGFAYVVQDSVCV